MPSHVEFEYAKSSRSTCKTCNTLIESGELRFGTGTISSVASPSVVDEKFLVEYCREKSGSKSLKFFHPTAECAAEHFRELGNIKLDKVEGFKSLESVKIVPQCSCIVG